MRTLVSWRAGMLLVLGLLLAACGPKQLLKKYNLENQTVAVIAAVPPQPLIFDVAAFDRGRYQSYTPFAYLSPNRGARSRAELELAQARLDSAIQDIDVAAEIARKTLVTSGKTLAYTPVNSPEQADFVIDVRVYNYGIASRARTLRAFYVLEGEVVLLDNTSGDIIWRKALREWMPFDLGFEEDETIETSEEETAFDPARERLSQMTVEEMRFGLERLSDIIAKRVVNHLTEDYEASRPVTD